MSWKTVAKFCRRTDVKLTLLYVFTFLISALVLCGFLYFRLKHQLIKEVDRFLLDEVKELSEALSPDPGSIEAMSHFESGIGSRTFYPIYFRIFDGRGSLLYNSKSFQDIGYGVIAGALSNAKSGKETREEIHLPGRRTTLRIVTTPVHGQGQRTYIIQMGTPLRFVRKNLSNFKYDILAAFPVMLILGALGGWMLAGRSLSPIGYIVSKARSITSMNLSERLTPRGTGDEMDDLIQTMNEMIARLEDSFMRMSEFTADVSHELKTPLCALRGEAEVLLSKVRTPEDYQEGLSHFIEQFDHLNRMVNDLILLSRFDSAQMGLQMAPLRLDLLIREICDLFQILAEQKQIRLVIEPWPEVTLMGDRVRLQQLFTNLIDNAIKYTDEGKVEVSFERSPNVIQVRIRDTGIGIPRAEQEKIFKRFYRVDKSRSRETGGAGLGLSIADWIARAHHGTIEVGSELNRGSTFTVSLPAPNA